MKRKWIIPLALGFILPLALYFLYRKVSPPLDTETVNIAQQNGYDPRTYNDIMDLLGKAEDNNGKLTDAQWLRVQQIYKDPTSRLKREAFSVMMMMGNTSRRNEVLSTTRTLLNDPDPSFQTAAVICLRRFGDASWRQEATQRMNSKDEDTRKMMNDLLAQGGASK